MARAFAEIAFTASVLEAQSDAGSRERYAEWLTPEADRGDRIGPVEKDFIEARDGAYQATVSETGWPYVQFKGGPKGFLKVIDDQTIAYADYRGSRQYVSLGNLRANDRVALILTDYPNQLRVKILGRASHIDVKEDPGFVTRLHVGGGTGKPERATVIKVEALDWSCPQHIPQRLTGEEMAPYLRQMQNQLQTRIVELEAENAELKAFLGQKN